MRKTCVFCDYPPQTKLSTYCQYHGTGSKPAKVEYAVTAAVRRGDLKPAKECVCVDCGAPARHYDHRDYNKPLEVGPVCPSCNARRGPAMGWGKVMNPSEEVRRKFHQDYGV